MKGPNFQLYKTTYKPGAQTPAEMNFKGEIGCGS